MSYLPVFRNKRREGGGASLTRWWRSDKDNVAKDLYAYCVALERAQTAERFRRYCYHMIATGRAPISYGLSMPGFGNDGSYAGDRFGTEYTPPSENWLALALDVFANRVWCERPHLQIVPSYDDDFKLRDACSQGTEWLAQMFEKLRAWDVVSAMGKASGVVGTGWARIGEAGPGEIELTHVQDDSVLLDPTAGSNPRSKQIRLFRDRQSLIQQFAKGPNADVIRDKIERNAGCRLGFYELDAVGYDDTIAIIEAWFEKRGNEAGRHVICLDDVSLVDEEYDDCEAPLIKLVHEPIEECARGQGIPEQALAMQREVDRIADNLVIQEKIMAFGRVYSRKDNGVTEDDIAGTFIEWNLEKPHQEPGLAPPEQLYAKQREIGQNILLRFGISQSSAQGSSSPGVTASVAMMSEMQIADVRHRAHGLRLQTAVEDIGRAMIRQAAKTKPTVMSGGQKIDFGVIEQAMKNGKIAGYPVSGLPQSISGRQQIIENRYRNGQLDRAMYQRLLNIPNTNQEGFEETASIDLIYAQLDKMEETGKFEPVIPYSDLNSAKSIAIKRYSIRARQSLAKNSKVKQKTLQLLSQYIVLVQEKIDEAGASAAPSAPAQQVQAQAAPAVPPQQ